MMMSLVVFRSGVFALSNFLTACKHTDLDTAAIFLKLFACFWVCSSSPQQSVSDKSHAWAQCQGDKLQILSPVGLTKHN